MVSYSKLSLYFLPFFSVSVLFFFYQGRGLKIDDMLKDDEVLTAFLLRDAELSESIVYQLVNAQIRLEQVSCGRRVEGGGGGFVV